MTDPAPAAPPSPAHAPGGERVDHLDAVRAFALLLGVVFHASLSFLPFFIGWAVMDVSTSASIAGFVLVSHAFRMEVFFLIAGYFSRLALHRHGTATFVRSRVVRLVVPFVAGWFVLRPLLVSGWIMGMTSMRGEVDIPAALRAGFVSLASLPAGIFTGSHLWFLHYLVLITALLLVARLLVARAGAWRMHVTAAGDAAVAWLARTSWSPLVLALPTAVVLGRMSTWGVDTPEGSLWPHPPVLLLYGGCFALGWMLRRSGPALAAFSRITPVRVVLAVVAVVATVMLAGMQGEPAHPRYALAKLLFQFTYGVTMWSLVMLTLGVFERLCRRPSRIVRYVADASYWIYLIHLPVVVWLQVAVAELPLHWSIKLVGVSLATVAVSLVTYDLVVRSTVIGRILNGRRRPRAIPVWVGRPAL